MTPERVWLWRARRSQNEEAASELSETKLDGPNPNKAPRGKATEWTESCAEAHLGQATSGVGKSSGAVNSAAAQAEAAAVTSHQRVARAQRLTRRRTMRAETAEQETECGARYTGPRRRQRSRHQLKSISGGSSVTCQQARICLEVRLQISTVVRAWRRW